MLACYSIQAVAWYMQVTLYIVYHWPQVVVKSNAWSAGSTRILDGASLLQRLKSQQKQDHHG